MAALAAREAVGEPDGAAFAVTRVASSDIETQAASLREWSQVYEQLTPGRFDGRLHELRLPGVQLFRETTNQAVHEAGAGRQGARALGLPVRSEGPARFRGEPVAADDVVMLGARDELDFYTPRDFEILGVVVDEEALAAHARQVEHHELPEPSSGGVLRPGRARASELRGLVASILQSLDVNAATLRHAQAQRVIGQTLLGAVFALVADDASSAKPAGGAAGRAQLVADTKAYMRARIADPITVADLCRVLGVSRRTLQYAFGEVLGINPVAFLRAMRLNGVRRDLLAAAPPKGKVQDIAARWGFWHLGHFVTDYRRMFGELPSATLNARAKGAPAGD